jgi:hypothetical protein
MFSGKPYQLLSIYIILFSLLFLFIKSYSPSEYYFPSEEPGSTNIENCSNSVKPLSEMIKDEPVLNLLGKNFSEIKELLGEPAEEGFSSWNGPHNYIRYNFNEGIVHFNSPQILENNIVTSIRLSSKLDILCVRVGMTFSEIISILGNPAFGPEHGINDLYYMDYFCSNINNPSPEVLISFSAEKIDGPTTEAFIKWEGFDYSKVDNIMISHAVGW